jgi:type VI secretion system ImpH/TssG family protein
MLGREAYNMNFFQAVHMVERLFPDKAKVGSGDELGNESIRFETHNTLSFPPGEIAAILPPLAMIDQLVKAEKEHLPSQEEKEETKTEEEEGDDKPKEIPDPIAQARLLNMAMRMELTFMGLYGVSSPLPSYFIDPVTLRKVEYFQLKKFLDIFGHRLYSLFYRAWKKYRHPLQFIEKGEDDYTQRLVALTGQWPNSASTRRPHLPPPGQTAEFKALSRAAVSETLDLRRIPYARFFGSRVRSAKGLEQLLRGYFSFPRVRIQEFVRQYVPIPIPAALGSLSTVLGDTMRLGETMEDRVGRFEIEIGPLPKQDLRRFLPSAIAPKNGESVDFSKGLAPQIHDLVAAYLRDPFDYGITVLVNQEIKSGLGSPEFLLGMGTYLTSQEDNDLLRLRF